MPFDPSNLNTGSTFHVQPQAGPVQPQGGPDGHPDRRAFRSGRPPARTSPPARPRAGPPALLAARSARASRRRSGGVRDRSPRRLRRQPSRRGGPAEGEALALGVWTRRLSRLRTSRRTPCAPRSPARSAGWRTRTSPCSSMLSSFRQLAARSWKPRRLDDKGIEQLDGDLQLEEPGGVDDVGDGGDHNQGLPRGSAARRDLTVTILETLQVEALSISTPSYRSTWTPSLNDHPPARSC